MGGKGTTHEDCAWCAEAMEEVYVSLDPETVGATVTVTESDGTTHVATWGLAHKTL